MKRVASRTFVLQTALHSRRRRNFTLRTHGTKNHRKYKSTFQEGQIQIFQNPTSVRAVRRQLLVRGLSVGFVPTMGALHDGHLTLIRKALQENSQVFVSIFVNPTQFAVHEDLDSYPKTLDADMAKLKQLEEQYRKDIGGVQANRPSCIRGVFVPTVNCMYPTLPPTSDVAGHGSFVTITPLGSELEGASRPIFFRGVATVCTKLFNIIQPERVYFGQKDIQQSVLIKRMVKDFHIPTEVRVVETVREANGLAMSSRNVYLGGRRREDAAVLSRALFAAADLYQSGVLQVGRLRSAAFDVFAEDAKRTRADGRVGPSCRLEIDYIAMSGADTMETIKDSQDLNPNMGAILSAAMVVSPVDNPTTQEELNQKSVRLIDNVILKPKVDEETRRERRQRAAASAATSNSTNKQASDQQAAIPKIDTSEKAPHKHLFRKIGSDSRYLAEISRAENYVAELFRADNPLRTQPNEYETLDPALRGVTYEATGASQPTVESEEQGWWTAVQADDSK